MFRLLLILLLFQLSQLSVAAADEGQVNPAVAEDSPQWADSLGRDTPRGAIAGFLLATDEGDFVKAAEYLDLRNLPKRYKNTDATELAEKLAIVIEREIWIDLDEVSNDADGEIGDGLPSYRDQLGRISGDEGDDYVILLQRVPDGKGGRIWKVSNATVSKVNDLYTEFGYGPIAQAVADVVPAVDILGVELFKWILMLGAGLAAYPMFLIAGFILARVFSAPASPLYARVKRFFMLPVALLGVNAVMNYIVVDLGLGIGAQRIIEAQTINTALFLWGLLIFVGLMRDFYAKKLSDKGSDGAVVLLRPFAQALQIILTLIVFLVWLDNTGFDITTILAGLGVGGIAVALALQKPMEDIFGAISLYTLQPVQIGDLCRVGSEFGNVEEIGLRMTRIRTLDNTLISIPNAKLAIEIIDNFSARGRIRYKPVLRLRVDISRKQIDRILERLRQMLLDHEKVDSDGMRVRFQNIGEDALEIGIIAHILETDFADYLVVAEDLNLKIMDILDAEGVTLAVPTRNVLVEQQD